MSIGTGTTSRRKTRGTGNLGCEGGKLKVEFIRALNGVRQQPQGVDDLVNINIIAKSFAVANAQLLRMR